ncbi:MAG: hypothetical protein CMH54_02800 [Myxococcales bacterium]|nr:hypothetical protein [Myxococcales bacterium]
MFLRPAKNQPTSSSVHHNIWAVFTGNLRHVFEGDAVHTQLVVARGRSGTSPHLQLQNPEIEIAMFLPDEGVVSLHKGRFLDDGRGYDREANDGIYSFSFVPSQVVPKGASGEVKMRATYAIPFHEGPSGTTWKEGMSMFRFSYYQKAPMEFTGRFRETIEEGSLVVYAGVKIQQPGWYKLRSLLFDATGAPVAQSMIDEEFDTNVDEVRFVFFGRVLRQHKVGGPYTVGRVDGYLFEPGVPPPRPQVRAIVDGYETRTYEPTAFSDAEWDSPAKQRRLDLLREVRSKGLPY